MSFHPDELRGVHGRWSASSGGRRSIERSPAAASRGTARGRKAAVTGSAREVHTAFRRREAGHPLTERQRSLTEHAAVKGSGSFWDRMRQANADRARGVTHAKSKPEALRSARRTVQASHGGLHVHPGGARAGVKQSFTGKAVAVRGKSPVAMKSPKKSARTLMAKPTTEYVGRRRAAV